MFVLYLRSYMCWFCNWVCVCVGFVIGCLYVLLLYCAFVYVWIFNRVLICNMWVCVYMCVF